jgi:diacylglycerol kinase family enzyme
MAEAAGRRFLLCVGVGFDAEVVGRVHAARRQGLSQLNYVPAAAAAFFAYGFPPVEVVVDGVAAPPGPVQVVVANTRTWGGPLVLARDARIDDGLLDVCLFYGGRGALTGQALRAMLKRPLAKRPDRAGASGALLYQAREVYIPGPPSAPVEMDGDPGPPLPLHIKVLPKAVKAIVPVDAK